MDPSPGVDTPISVVIPAHNEAAVIGRCISTMLAGAEEGELEIVVVPNGCTDATAAIARSFGSPVRVVESTIASKAAALNVGDAAATSFPRFYVDADVEVDIGALRSVANVLRRGDVEVAAPKARIELEGRPFTVRAYYAIWTSLPYHQEDMVGSGLYALSEMGRSRFGPFPEDQVLFADDRLVRTLAPRNRRRSVADASFTIHPPFSISSLVRIRRRMYMANLTAERTGEGEDPQEGPRQRWALFSLGKDPRRWPEIAVYLGVVSLAKLGARRRVRKEMTSSWDRDESARTRARAPK